MAKMAMAIRIQNLALADETTGHLTRRSNNTRQVIGQSLLYLTCLCFPALALAEGAGSITHLGGVLTATHADGTSRMLAVKSEILEGDTLKTEVNTFARIKFTDGSEVVLRPETVFKVDAYSYTTARTQQDSFLVSLLKGGMRSVTGLLGKRNPDRFKLNTAAATIGIRGTHFGALLCNNDCSNIPTVSGQVPQNGLHTDTAQGTVVVYNAAGMIEVPAGAFSYTPSATAPPKLVQPSQGIQVTIPAAISGGVGAKDGTSCTVGP